MHDIHQRGIQQVQVAFTLVFAEKLRPKQRSGDCVPTPAGIHSAFGVQSISMSTTTKDLRLDLLSIRVVTAFRVLTPGIRPNARCQL